MSTQGRAEPPPKTETVYEGPALPVTNYWSSASGAAAAVPAKSAGNKMAGSKTAPEIGGTVFDEKTFVPKRCTNAAAVAATERAVRGASLRFFLVAGITVLEGMYANQRGDQNAVLASAAVVFFFTLLGIFAYRKSKAAFMMGILVYALQTALLAWVGYNTGMMFLVGYAIVVKCTIMYRLWVAYGLVCELQTA